MSTKILGNEELNILRAKTPYSLPDNPSDKGFNARQIKTKFWEGYLLLFNWLKETQASLNNDFATTNSALLNESKRIDVILTYFSNGKANFAVRDRNNNIIDETYELKSEASTKFNQLIADIQSVSSASGNKIAGSQNINADGIQYTITLSNTQNATLSTITQYLPLATTLKAGLLSGSDKEKINNLESDLTNFLANAKAYTDEKLQRDNIVNILGAASHTLIGLLSSEDKKKIDALYSLLGEKEDADTVVNTINEVLAIFSSYPEGVDIVSQLEKKVNYSDVINTLDSEETSKPLSAKMGKELKTKVDTKAELAYVNEELNKKALKGEIIDGSITTTKIADNSITKDKICSNVLNFNISKTAVYKITDADTLDGYWTRTGSGNPFVKPQPGFKCIKVNIDNDDGLLNIIMGNEVPAVPWGYLEYSDGTFGTLPKMTLVDYSLKDVKSIMFNFFNGGNYTSEFSIVYLDTISTVRKEINNDNLKITPMNIDMSKEFNKNNVELSDGYYGSDGVKKPVPVNTHKCFSVYVNNAKRIKYNGTAAPGVNYGVYVKKDGSIVSLGNGKTGNIEIFDAVELRLNFFDGDGYATSFTVEFEFGSEEKDIYEYDDYLYSGYEFANKKCLFVGDSITKGYTSGTTTTTNTYAKLFCDYVGAVQVNNSLAGALYVSGKNTIPVLLTQLTNTENKDTFDYVFIAGGINDWQLESTETEFRTAVENTIDYALNNFTKAKIILITPVNTAKTEDKPLSVNKFRRIITEVAMLKDDGRISVVQGSKFNFPTANENPSFISSMYGDRLHPSELGYKTAYLHGLIKALCR